MDSTDIFPAFNENLATQKRAEGNSADAAVREFIRRLAVSRLKPPV